MRAAMVFAARIFGMGMDERRRPPAVLKNAENLEDHDYDYDDADDVKNTVHISGCCAVDSEPVVLLRA
ncbi:MAG: hypothetical protein ABI680_11785 [Chthoniobacteraceae bacterium]